MALTDLNTDISKRQYAEDIILTNPNFDDWIKNNRFLELPQPINLKTLGSSLVDATDEANVVYDDSSGVGLILDNVLYLPKNATKFTPMTGFPHLTNFGASWWSPAIDAWGGGVNGGYPTGSGGPSNISMPLVFFRTAVKRTTPTKITLYMAFPSTDTDAFAYKYDTYSRKICYIATKAFCGMRSYDDPDTEWSDRKSMWSRPNTFLISINNNLQRVRGLSKLGTISKTITTDYYDGEQSASLTAKYDIYELASYDRYEGGEYSQKIKFIVQGLAADSVTTNAATWNSAVRWVNATGGLTSDYYTGTFINWCRTSESSNPYSASAAISAAGGNSGYFKHPGYKSSLITLFEKEYTAEQIKQKASVSILPGTELSLSTLPTITKVVYDPYLVTLQETTVGSESKLKESKLYSLKTTRLGYVDENTDKGSVTRTTTIQDPSKVYPAKTVSIYSYSGLGNAAEAVFPPVVLQAPIVFTTTEVIPSTGWQTYGYRNGKQYSGWYVVKDKNGNEQYEWTGTIVKTTPSYNFAVDMANVPTFVTAIGTRFRNHSAKYAVLANDADYFEYSWRGTVDQYQNDPTITLTLTYGDQVVVSKTMDGTAAAASTFQHGPFLLPPTTEGQLVQITGIVTDTRGRASAEKTFTITDNNSQDILEYLRFYSYNYPTVAVQGYRCLQNGTPDPDNGTYIKLTATYAFSPVDYGLTTYSEGTTDGQLKIKLVPHSGTLSQSDYNYTITTANGNKEIMLAVGLDQSVDIQVQATDFIGNVFNASTEFIPSARVVLDFRREGSALSIGKRNEFDNALEVAWDTTFYGNVTIKGNVNITGQKQTATTADAVSYNDTKNIGARTVQAAIDTLATRAGVSTTQVQAIVNQAIANLDIPDDAHINQLITTKINNIVFPPSISEARALELIANELTGYYTKEEVDTKIAGVTIDPETIDAIIQEYVKDMPTSSEAVATANQAKSIAEDAQEAATNAETAANTAVTTANSAKAIAEDAKSKIDQAVAGLAPAAEDVAFSDTISLGATNVQLAIVKTNEKILTSTQIQAMIDTKFNSIVNGNAVHY